MPRFGYADLRHLLPGALYLLAKALFLDVLASWSGVMSGKTYRPPSLPSMDPHSTYYPPTDDEVEYYRSLLKEPVSEARSIREEIERQTRLLAGLREKQKAFSDFIARHSAFLAPIRRLPPEVLQTIFIFCLPTDHNPSLAPREAPFLLSHICRRWRDVAFRTPRLWARLHIHIPIYPEVPTSYQGLRSARDAGRLLEPARLTQEEIHLYRSIVQRWEDKMHDYRIAIEAWLTRAAKCPLTVSLQQSSNVSDATKGKEAQDSILETVFRFSKQWKSIQIHAPTSILERLLTMSKDDLESLEHFAAQWDISYRDRPTLGAPGGAGGGGGGGNTGETFGENNPGITIFTDAPNLKRLSLQNVPYPLKHFHVQWDQITELILGKFALPNSDIFAPRPVLFAHRALDILERCPNLVRCRLTLGKTYAFSHNTPGGGGPQYPLIDESRAVVRLEYLECFCINEGNPLGNFFEFLEVPRLKELVFKTSQYPRAAPRPSPTPTPTLTPAVTQLAAQPQDPQDDTSAAPRRGATTSCLMPLFERYGENIEKLLLDESMLSNEDMERCFKLLKNLTHLKLTRMSYIRPFLDRTSPPGTEPNFVVGYLSRKIWERMTPSMFNYDAGSEGGDHAVGMSCCDNGAGVDLLLPKLTSFSCRVHAPELVQDHIIQFLRSRRRRRHPSSSAPTTALLKHFSIMFYATEPEQRYKNIPDELQRLGVDMDGMTLEIKYRRTYGDSLLGPSDFIVKPLLRPKWPTTGDRPGMFFGVEDTYEDDE
ncbi:hypothetical protein MD484_g416, partial [Candolleomyces efflorescens]